MNNVQLIGRLTTDVEVREAATGKKYAQFAVAINSGVKKVLTNYIDIVAFDNNAQLLGECGKKGTKLSVQGHLSQSQYIDQRGSRHNTLKVVLEKFQIIPKNAVEPDSGEAAAGEA